MLITTTLTIYASITKSSTTLSGISRNYVRTVLQQYHILRGINEYTK